MINPDICEFQKKKKKKELQNYNDKWGKMLKNVIAVYESQYLSKMYFR